MGNVGFVSSPYFFSNKITAGVNSLACDYSVHTVNGKLLDEIFFTSMDITFNVTHEFLQVYQTPIAWTGQDLMCLW